MRRQPNSARHPSHGSVDFWGQPATLKLSKAHQRLQWVVNLRCENLSTAMGSARPQSRGRISLTHHIAVQLLARAVAPRHFQCSACSLRAEQEKA
jgi:hypothetical protein